MNFIEEINDKGKVCLWTENEFNMLRMMGHAGHKVKEAQKVARAARADLMLVYRASGYTVEQLEQMVDEKGEPLLVYGIADIIRQEE